jgi:hypothetical protein
MAGSIAAAYMRHTTPNTLNEMERISRFVICPLP